MGKWNMCVFCVVCVMLRESGWWMAWARVWEGGVV